MWKGQTQRSKAGGQTEPLTQILYFLTVGWDLLFSEVRRTGWAFCGVDPPSTLAGGGQARMVLIDIVFLQLDAVWLTNPLRSGSKE